jgi:hypothetical protein
MAQITGAQGADLTQKLSQYLVDNAGLIDSTTVANLLNQYLPANEKVGLTSGGVISNGIYKKFGDFDVISNKIEVVTEGLWSNGSGSIDLKRQARNKTIKKKQHIQRCYRLSVSCLSHCSFYFLDFKMRSYVYVYVSMLFLCVE